MNFRTLLLTILAMVYLSAKVSAQGIGGEANTGMLRNYSDVILMVAGAVLSAIFTLILIKIFRPSIKIGTPEIITNEKGIHKIHVSVFNTSRCYDAINVQIEVALLRDTKSVHLQIDKPNFLILPHQCSGDNSRVFKAIISDPSDERTLRVRIYGQHCFTGFGKSFEKSFKKVNNTYHEI